MAYRGSEHLTLPHTRVPHDEHMHVGTRASMQRACTNHIFRVVERDAACVTWGCSIVYRAALRVVSHGVRRAACGVRRAACGAPSAQVEGVPPSSPSSRPAWLGVGTGLGLGLGLGVRVRAAASPWVW